MRWLSLYLYTKSLLVAHQKLEDGWVVRKQDEVPVVRHVRKEEIRDICGYTDTVVHIREYIGYG